MNTSVYKKKKCILWTILTLSILSKKVTQNANITVGNCHKPHMHAMIINYCFEKMHP